LDLSEEKKPPPKRPRSPFGALVLATVLSVIGAIAMAGSIVIENFTRRFPNRGAFNVNFNVTRPFNATRTFNVQVLAQRVPTNFTYASWLNILGFACLVGITIILVVLLLQSRSGFASRITKA
jgi:hypothetical protein